MHARGDLRVAPLPQRLVSARIQAVQRLQSQGWRSTAAVSRTAPDLGRPPVAAVTLGNSLCPQAFPRGRHDGHPVMDPIVVGVAVVEGVRVKRRIDRRWDGRPKQANMRRRRRAGLYRRRRAGLWRCRRGGACCGAPRCPRRPSAPHLLHHGRAPCRHRHSARRRRLYVRRLPQKSLLLRRPRVLRPPLVECGRNAPSRRDQAAPAGARGGSARRPCAGASPSARSSGHERPLKRRPS